MKTSEWVSNSIAALAFAVALGSAILSNNAVELQKQALATVEAQWLEAGPVFSVNGTLAVFDPVNNQITSVRPGTEVDGSSLANPNQLMVLLSVANRGRSAGSIQEVGFYSSAGVRQPITTGAIQCRESPNQICELPYKVEAFDAFSTSEYIPKQMTSSLACYEHLKEEGIIIYVTSGSGVTYDWDTGVKLSLSSACPSRGP